MAEQRPTFRFRLPWLTATPAPRPAAPVETPTPAPTLAVEPQLAPRPPFRPAGQAPTQAQSTTRTESQPSSPAQSTRAVGSYPPSPSRGPIQSRAASQPSSPFRPVFQSRTVSQPSSPSRVVSQSRVASQPSTPPRAAAPRPPVATQTRSPPRPAAETQVEKTTQAITEAPPPPRPQNLSQSRVVSQPSTPPRAAAPQPQAARPPQPQTLEQPPKPAAAVTGTPILTQKPSDSSSIVSEPPSEAIAKEVKEMEVKTKTIASEEPRQTLTEHVKKDAAFGGIQKHMEKQERNHYGSQTKKTMISPAKDRAIPSEPRPKHAISNGEKAPFQKAIVEDVSKFVHNLTTGNPNTLTGEKPVSVVTLAGDNKGASMQLGSDSSKRESTIHIHRGYKLNPDESTEATIDGEGTSGGRKPKDTKTKEDEAPEAYINSNIQSINNSILFSSTIKERDPGVHLVISRNRTDPINPSTRTDSMDARKAEFNVTPAQNLTYEPTIRRRCLGGLFMESSDSDPDNPDKPRRHGCRYGRREKSKESDEIDVL